MVGPGWNSSTRTTPSQRVFPPRSGRPPATRSPTKPTPTPPAISLQRPGMRYPANPFSFKPPPQRGYVPPWGRLPKLSALPPKPPKGVRFAPDTVYQGHERIPGQYRNLAKLGPSAPAPPRLTPRYGNQGYISSHVTGIPY
ncbi:MAG: hypothetical protein JSR76_08405 [Verrucomicrobia bacterium]|nr:hypothetical protein [Verrucomicrobiota bacterium]